MLRGLYLLIGCALLVGGCASASVLEIAGTDGNDEPHPVVVVGAGLSGLSAAYELTKNGQTPLIFDARSRLGGRAWSTPISTGDNTNLGGELINTEHAGIQTLAAELGVNLIRVYADKRSRRALLGGTVYTRAELEILAAPLWAQVEADKRQITLEGGSVEKASNGKSAHLSALNQLSILDYLERHETPTVVKHWVKQLYGEEYGFELDELNALHLFTGDVAGDEKLTIEGGLSTLVNALSATLTSPVRLQHRLIRVSRLDDGTTQLAFETPEGERLVRAEQVILALPLPVLRNSVSVTGDVPVEALLAPYASLSFGANDKFFLLFERPFWDPGADTWVRLVTEDFVIWGPSIDASPGRFLTAFRSGESARVPQTDAHAASALASLRTVFGEEVVNETYERWIPGEQWFQTPLTQGSYSGGIPVGGWDDVADNPRQCSQGVCVAGATFVPEPDRGFMNGAVLSGQRAALNLQDMAAHPERS